MVGLEIAASAAELGIKVTVIEIAPRILSRVCDEETSAIVHQRHRDFGVDIRTGTVCAGLQTMSDGRLAVVTKAGDTIAADLIVVGAGAVPDETLAKAAGLAVQDGILVDDRGRTSDPAIFAAGDCTRFAGPNGPVRLENWRHAQEHGAVGRPQRRRRRCRLQCRAVVLVGAIRPLHPGRGLAGGAAGRARAPQGQRQGDAAVRARRRAASPTRIGINAQRDIATIRRLIERRIAVDAAELADPAKPLNAMLKQVKNTLSLRTCRGGRTGRSSMVGTARRVCDARCASAAHPSITTKREVTQ